MKYKLIIIRIILIILLIIWGMAITSFSSQTGEESVGMSEKITYKVIDIFYGDYYEKPLEQQNDIFSFWHTIIRKGAHMTEYAIFAVLLSLFLLTFTKIKLGINKPLTNYIIITVVAAIIFAAIDEIHQGFVEGRSPSTADVGIDAMGALIGSFIVGLIRKHIISRHT